MQGFFIGLDGFCIWCNNGVIMQRQSEKPPGCFYIRKKRYWWRGRLPNETKIRSRKITPPNSQRALLAVPANLAIAYQIVWGWRRDASETCGGATPRITVAELVARYLAHASEYYRRADGTATGERLNIEHATRVLTARFGGMSADALDVEHVERVQQAMIEAGLARTTINKRLNIIKRLYRWAARKRFVPPSSWHAVAVVENLKAGRSKARETSKILPADEWSVDRTLEQLPAVLWRMVMLHRLAGFRSTELCIMRPRDVDRRGDIWIYAPAWHKEQHLQQARHIPLGPLAQWVLAPMLDRPLNQYCFMPAEAMHERWASMRAARRTPVQPSQISRAKPEPQLARHERYDRRSYYTAVQHAWRRACKAVEAQQVSLGLPSVASILEPPRLCRWSPHRLRHSFLTRVQRRFGSESARASGGHASLDATEIYLERDLAAASDVARQIG